MKEEEVVAAKAKAKEEAAAKLIKLAEIAKKEEEEEKERKMLFDEEVARRKVAKASKPKAKGIVIDDFPKKNIPTYKGNGKRKMYEEEPVKSTKTYTETTVEQIETDVIIAEQA